MRNASRAIRSVPKFELVSKRVPADSRALAENLVPTVDVVFNPECRVKVAREVLRVRHVQVPAYVLADRDLGILAA